MQRIDITQDFALPVDRVYAFLSEHENLGALFGAKIRRMRDGDTERNGAGSVRRLRVGPGPSFDETVTEAVHNERIAYRISRGSPLRGHHGLMEFSTTPAGSRLHYVIEFGSAVPGLARLVKLGLERNLRRALPRVEERA